MSAEQTGFPKLRIQLCYGERALVPTDTLESCAINEGDDARLTVSIQVSLFLLELAYLLD
jgi:hypothetical protein